jgi:hypothetical protein
MHVRCPRCHDYPYETRRAATILGQCARPGHFLDVPFSDEIDRDACPTCRELFGSYVEIVGLSTDDELSTFIPRKPGTRSVLFAFAVGNPQLRTEVRQLAVANAHRFITLAFDTGMLLALANAVHPSSPGDVVMRMNGLALYEPGHTYLATNVRELVALLEQCGCPAIE